MTTQNRVTLDSGNRDEYSTGARRDNGGDKPNPLRMTPEAYRKIFGFKFDRSDPLWTGADKVLDPEYRLIPPLPLNRVQGLFERGAEKYGDNNWQKGIPMQRIFESMMRHMILWWAGDTTEDHAAAVVWNAMTAMVIEHEVIWGQLPRELGNAGALRYGEHSLEEIRKAQEEK